MRIWSSIVGSPRKIAAASFVFSPVLPKDYGGWGFVADLKQKKEYET